MIKDLEKYSLWVGIALTFVSLMVLQAWANWLTFAPFAVGVLLVSWALYRYMGCQAGDERVQKITIYAMTNSWLAAFFLVAMYVLFDVIGIIRNLTPMQILAAVMSTMLLLFGAWFAYFWHRGDVQ